jgi:hypothetical protein
MEYEIIIGPRGADGSQSFFSASSRDEAEKIAKEEAAKRGLPPHPYIRGVWGDPIICHRAPFVRVRISPAYGPEDAVLRALDDLVVGGMGNTVADVAAAFPNLIPLLSEGAQDRVEGWRRLHKK